MGSKTIEVYSLVLHSYQNVWQRSEGQSKKFLAKAHIAQRLAPCQVH
jgi:hypothetical protein